ncbi:hypothetical protein LTR70_002904 [Exophiala xenobiotica]|uniref:Uncharacterized protein n=1 Tax=Lithohypha guttulata TaxID=1690604 RepID=A0ABR0KHN7_9EURO|nr:hypothetical protein LTR24_002489 [Lithohypha guttulata]KAK5324457.1 hypothetical protein LTR70_002904 [Exophiala xenobiotica]
MRRPMCQPRRNLEYPTERRSALDVNDFANTVHAGIRITTHGSDWYYTVTANTGVAILVSLGLAFTEPRSERLFYHITAAITLVATVVCFSMGSTLG